MGPCTLARLCFCAALAFSRKNPIRSPDGRRALGTPFERNLENRPYAKLRGSDPPERSVPRPVGGRAPQPRAILLTSSLTWTSSAPLDTATRRLEGRRS